MAESLFSLFLKHFMYLENTPDCPLKVLLKNKLSNLLFENRKLNANILFFTFKLTSFTNTLFKLCVFMFALVKRLKVNHNRNVYINRTWCWMTIKMWLKIIMILKVWSPALVETQHRFTDVGCYINASVVCLCTFKISN